MTLGLYDVIYFIIITTVFLGFLIGGLNFLKDITNNVYAIYVFLGFLAFIYCSIIGIYFFGVSIKNIFIFLSIVMMLASIAAFLVFWYAPAVCAGADVRNHFLYTLLTILEIVIVILLITLYRRDTGWDLKDSGILFLMLVILRLMYWVVEMYSFTWLKTIGDITLLTIIITSGIRFYRVLRA